MTRYRYTATYLPTEQTMEIASFDDLEYCTPLPWEKPFKQLDTTNMYIYVPPPNLPTDARITAAVDYHRAHHPDRTPIAVTYRGASNGKHEPTGLPIQSNTQLRAGDIAIITD